mgnify:CR=1 FL=1
MLRRGDDKQLRLAFVQDSMNWGPMSTEQVHGYLEQMVPWP